MQLHKQCPVAFVFRPIHLCANKVPIISSQLKAVKLGAISAGTAGVHGVGGKVFYDLLTSAVGEPQAAGNPGSDAKKHLLISKPSTSAGIDLSPALRASMNFCM